jgi:pyruvate formate lyase activating enzyme
MTTRRDMLKSAAALMGAASLPLCAKSAPQPAVPKALYWEPMGDLVRCNLCPHGCTIDNGKTALCKTRMNRNGEMVLLGYGNPCSINVDPIEKKPFYHVLPGARAYSFAIAGCNMRCKNCQNWSISQASPLETRNENLSPADIVKRAVGQGCAAVAYTYSEPTVWYEFMLDTAKAARSAGLKNIWVTNGYISEAPLLELAQYMDAATIDIKGFDDAIYHKLNAGSLEPVLRTIKAARKAGMWIEVSTLVVPEWSDSIAMISKMCEWVKTNAGEQTPFHFLRFFPQYQLSQLYPTPTKTLFDAQKAAHDAGLKFVYLGNVAEADDNTYCPRCGKPIVVRNGYIVKQVSITKGACAYCKLPINGVWIS